MEALHRLCHDVLLKIKIKHLSSNHLILKISSFFRIDRGLVLEVLILTLPQIEASKVIWSFMQQDSCPSIVCCGHFYTSSFMTFQMWTRFEFHNLDGILIIQDILHFFIAVFQNIVLWVLLILYRGFFNTIKKVIEKWLRRQDHFSQRILIL